MSSGQLINLIKQYVKNCNGCILSQKIPIKTTLRPGAPENTSWEPIHLDYAGPHIGIYLEILIDF